jgi:hypothetical protein
MGGKGQQGDFGLVGDRHDSQGTITVGDPKKKVYVLLDQATGGLLCQSRNSAGIRDLDPHDRPFFLPFVIDLLDCQKCPVAKIPANMGFSATHRGNKAYLQDPVISGMESRRTGLKTNQEY